MIDYNDFLVKTREYLHSIPELGRKEFKTQKYIIDNLEKLGIKHYKIDTGTVAVIEGKNIKGKVLGYRADIDALPIFEKSSKPYRSTHDGIMHACGHDAHTAIALGICKYFSKNNNFNGILKVFFQMDEEGDGGALKMIEAGCLKSPDVEYVLGLHVTAGLDTGKIEVKRGTESGASDTFDIKIKGKSAHGASPHCGKDAILTSCHLVLALQSIVSRNISPHDNFVLTIGKIHGGKAGNIICDEVDLKVNIRTVKKSTRDYVIKRIYEITENTCKAFDGDFEIVHHKGYEFLINNDFMTDTIISSAEELLGKENVFTREEIDLGVEDFCYFAKYSKGGFYHLGCRNEKLGITSGGHTDTFDVDPASLNIGFNLSLNILKKLFNEMEK